MTRTRAAALTAVVFIFVAVGVPTMIALIDVLLPVIAASNKWQFAAFCAAVAAPFFYLMFRRML